MIGKLFGGSMISVSKDDAFQGLFQRLDRHLSAGEMQQAQTVISNIPLDVFAAFICTDELLSFPAAAAHFPTMPTEKFQHGWVGSSGIHLLQQSVAFVRTCVREYEVQTGGNIKDANILDYGVGWGRLLRLFNKYVPEEQLFGVDAWAPILKIANALRVRGQLAQVSAIPTALPFSRKFDLIFAFSIFTHLSERAANAVAKVCAENLSEDGLVIFTIRPVAAFAKNEKIVEGYRTRGFGFEPNNSVETVDGHIPYGNSAVSLQYIRDNWPWLRIVGIEYNLTDPHQLLVLLRRSSSTP